MPVSAKVSPNDLFVKDKYVSEELRNLSKELGMLMITASQLNRSAVEEVEFDHSHISGGISKINTADNVFGIFTSRAMRERGKYQIQCMKSRSSTGVGMKIDLDYSIETMRITDPGISDSGESGYKSTASAVMDRIKSASTVAEKTDAAPVRGVEVESSKLRTMLSGLKSQQV
jgi:replicative DNA helicase